MLHVQLVPSWILDETLVSSGLAAVQPSLASACSHIISGWEVPSKYQKTIIYPDPLYIINRYVWWCPSVPFPNTYPGQGCGSSPAPDDGSQLSSEDFLKSFLLRSSSDWDLQSYFSFHSILQSPCWIIEHIYHKNLRCDGGLCLFAGEVFRSRWQLRCCSLITLQVSVHLRQNQTLCDY